MGTFNRDFLIRVVFLFDHADNINRNQLKYRQSNTNLSSTYIIILQKMNFSLFLVLFLIFGLQGTLNQTTCRKYVSELIKEYITNQTQFNLDIAKYLAYSGKDLEDLGFPDKCQMTEGLHYLTVELSKADSEGHNFYAYYGLCFTQLCSAEDLNAELSSNNQSILQNTTLYFVEPNLKSSMSSVSIVFLIIFLIIVVFGLVFSLKKWFAQCKNKQQTEDNNDIQVLSDSYSIQFTPEYDPSILEVHEEQSIDKRWSLQQKIKKYTIPEQTQKIYTFSAFKLLSIPLIIYGYQFYLGNKGMYNFMSYESVYDTLFAKIAVSAYYIPDIFFFISGYLFSSKAFYYGQIKDNCYDKLFKLIIKKFLRLYPLYIAAILIYWTITPSLHGGPVWYVYQREASQCNQSWWKAFLLVDNWFSGSCYDFAWFVPTEIQLVLINVFIFSCYYRSKRIGLIILGVILIVFWVLLLTISSPLPSSIDTTLDPNTLSYFKSLHSHAPFYFFGVLIAYLSSNEYTNSIFSKFAKNKILTRILYLFGIGIVILIIERPSVWRNTLLGFELGLSRMGIFLSSLLFFWPSIFSKTAHKTIIHKISTLVFPITILSGMIVASAFWCLDSFPYLSSNTMLEMLIPNLIISIIVGGFFGLLFSKKIEDKQEKTVEMIL